MPTFTPPPTHTPTTIPTDTPLPEDTATPLPTETPACTIPGCTIEMPSQDMGPGDDCYCDVHVCNPTDETFTDVPIFVILDVYGQYFFAPSFNEFDHYTQDVPPGMFTIHVLPLFSWPPNTGSAEGIVFYAAMTNPEITELFGELDMFEFGWHS